MMKASDSGADRASAGTTVGSLQPELFQALFEECADALLITNTHGSILSANRQACALLGYPRDTLIGQNIEMIHPELRRNEPWETLLRGGELNLRGLARSGTGRDLPVEVRARRIAYNDREVIEWIEHDISEQVRAEEVREEQLAMVFHDLRSPLGNVISSLEMLAAALPQDESCADLNMLVDIALRSGRRITHLLSQLLDIRRLEANQPLDLEPVTLQHLVQEAVDQVGPTAQSRHIDLRICLPTDLPELNLDHDLIQRVIYNLLDNAIKHTRAYTNVIISAEAPPGADKVTVIVADNGPGIPPEYQATIFDKYERIKREGAPKGMGLGLALCRMAVKAHGGHIWLENTPGGGATFKFTLPVAPPL